MTKPSAPETPDAPAAQPSATIARAHRRMLLEQIRTSCRNDPGTYRMLGTSGQVLYVGKSRTMRTRLLSYFRAKGRRQKSARILRHAHAIEWEYAPNEFGALLNELRLIKQHRPRFNSAMVRDDWPRAYIALTGGAVPGLRVVRRTDDAQASALWGPFRRVSALRDAVQVLGDVTGLRDCAIDEPAPGSTARALWFSDMPTPKRGARLRTPGCLRADLGSCPGPCIGGGESIAYARSVQQVHDFLESRDNAPLREAARRMEEAAAALQFERAAVWRDRSSLLEWLAGRVSRFHASMDRLTFRYDVQGPDGGVHVYLIRRGTVRASLALPTSSKEVRALRQLEQRVFFGADPKGGDVPLHDLEEFYLVASWFRRRPEELEHTARIVRR